MDVKLTEKMLVEAYGRDKGRSIWDTFQRGKIYRDTVYNNMFIKELRENPNPNINNHYALIQVRFDGGEWR